MESSPSALASIFDLALSRRQDLRVAPTIADALSIQAALEALPKSLPTNGLGTEETVRFVREKIAPGFAAGHNGSRYFGFVIGGTLPAAEAGDFLTTIYDLNCMTNLADQSINGPLEDRTLEMVLDLLDLPRDRFTVRTLTSGATASNVLGLACGRDFAVRTALSDPNYSVAEDGFGGITVQVLCDRPHASTVKAAGIVGIGRANVVDLGNDSGEMDVQKLETRLKEIESERTGNDGKGKSGVFVVLSHGEVNTGEFTSNVKAVRELCDRYNVWLHIDAAFGAFARIVPDLAFMGEHLELADSVTADGHKWLNVPYDCGLFFSRSLSLQQSIFGPSTRVPPPAYLVPPPPPADQTPELAAARGVPAPLNLGIENSRRFRALPLFCALVSLGKQGYSELVARNVGFARRVGEWMHTGPGSKWYEVLNANTGLVPGKVDLNVVLFRPKAGCGIPGFEGPTGGVKLVKAINETRRMYVSPGVGGAVRLAVSNWATGFNDGDEDFKVVVEVLEAVMRPETL
ncbi:Pyridoxal-dependent decarboxylase conserved domain [Ceratobasidium sp. AG-Ba]|nr:Pyridoxal-dependent decarboxylase conserved domain [Ceratobasidium sp. AG-Ba]